MPYIPVTQELAAPQGEPRYWHLDPTAVSDIGGGTYGVAEIVPSLNAETTINLPLLSGTGNTLMKAFATPIGYPRATEIPAGVALKSITAVTAASNQLGRILFETYTCNSDGTNEVLIRSSYTNTFSNQLLEELLSSTVLLSAVPLTADLRLVHKVYGARVSGPSVDMTAYFNGDEHPCWIRSTIRVSS